MEYACLETDTLAHVDERYYFGCYCRMCKHAARLNLVKLRNHLGSEFRLRDIRARLRCDRCNSRAITITFLNPSQRSGNLHHLFDKPMQS
jgi:hypothetical protein